MTSNSNMTDTKSISQIYPGRGLGWMSIGASLHGIMSRLKAQPQLYPQIELSFSNTEPILEPIMVNLPQNDIRLRFDGPDQRLRLIEIVDFSHTTFLYKNIELVRKPTTSEEATPSTTPVPGPSFRHVYNRLFGPAYAGEYTPPPTGQSMGTYILSYPGLAVRFSLKHKVWSEKADFVSLLTAAASPAMSIAIFAGESWPEARGDLYTRPPPFPRSIALVSKNNETVPDEVENIVIHSGGKVELVRRVTTPFTIRLNITTPLDIVAELGPPDAIFRKNLSRLSIHAAAQPSRNTSISPALHPSSVGTDRSSSAQSLAGLEEDSDPDFQEISDLNETTGSEMMYNYFHHGFDIMISSPATTSPSFPGLEASDPDRKSTTQKLVATKVFIHANIPGSYSFNRHRRSRWTIPLPSPKPTRDPKQPLTSEMRFSTITTTLKSIWKDHYSSSSEKESFERGMVLNRGWGESPESSIELLGEMEDSSIVDPGSSAIRTSDVAVGGQGVDGGVSSNTQLFGFPGMLFEVVKGDLVSCVTVY